MSARVDRVRGFWEALSPDSLARLEEVYAADTYFRDPFNEVRGVRALRRILEHMFAALDAPAFRVLEIVEDAEGAFMIWDFEFRIPALDPRRARLIHGVSHLRFTDEGRVAYHRDYWDAAGELYAQLPLVGRVVRWLGRKLGTDGARR